MSRAWEVDPTTYKTAANSWDDAFAVALAEVIASREGGVCRKTLVIPPGKYTLTRTWIDSPAKADQIQGLRISGAGKKVTEIDYSGDAPLINAINRLRNFRISGITFRSTNVKASWGYFYSDTSGGNNQDFWLSDVEWSGSWVYGIGLDGGATSNLNSEWILDGCALTNDATFTDAFFHSGLSPKNAQQDQFLNFRFNDCKFELGSGDVLRFDKGGHITVTGGSWIICGAAGGRFFYMPNQSHFDSVQHLVVIGTRFEVRNKNTRIIDCGWHAAGHVEWIGVSDDAQGFQLWAKDVLTHVYGAPSNGPSVGFTGCELMGFHQVRAVQARVDYTRCNFKNYPGGGFGDGKFLRSNTNQATYHFS